jgi:hypothetical protein
VKYICAWPQLVLTARRSATQHHNDSSYSSSKLLEQIRCFQEHLINKFLYFDKHLNHASNFILSCHHMIAKYIFRTTTSEDERVEHTTTNPQFLIATSAKVRLQTKSLPQHHKHPYGAGFDFFATSTNKPFKMAPATVRLYHIR